MQQSTTEGREAEAGSTSKVKSSDAYSKFSLGMSSSVPPSLSKSVDSKARHEKADRNTGISKLKIYIINLGFLSRLITDIKLGIYMYINILLKIVLKYKIIDIYCILELVKWSN